MKKIFVLPLLLAAALVLSASNPVSAAEKMPAPAKEQPKVEKKAPVKEQAKPEAKKEIPGQAVKAPQNNAPKQKTPEAKKPEKPQKK